MFKAIPYDYATIVKVSYSKKDSELFSVVVDASDKTVQWHGSWEQWGRDMAEAIVEKTSYIEREWRTMSLMAPDVEDGDNILVTVNLYCNIDGNPEVESVTKQII